ncbi:MAG: hypothetical protein NWR30_11370 [Salibacteraceae bacterium]|jgi:diaminopimelate decarboxylase|nr:hypothetical protein [Salibacteraceae bacterium]
MLDSKHINSLISQFKKSNLFIDSESHLHFYDFDVLHQNMVSVSNVFPANWSHAVAIKTNPLNGILSEISAFGFQLEAASVNEVLLASKSHKGTIIWDSPIKKNTEIEAVSKLENRIIINANSLHELQLLSPFFNYPNLSFGLRINPQADSRSDKSMDVGNRYSKFGEPISNLEQVKDFFKSSKQTLGLHIHSSSQSFDITPMVNNIRVLLDVIESWKKENIEIKYLDIGGGLGVNYEVQNTSILVDYFEALSIACPSLFEKLDFEIFTEFGRFYHAYAGFSLSVIEEVKKFKTHQTIIQHFGAENFLRECYQPTMWPHRINILNQNLKTNDNQFISSDVAGSLCFGGDYIAKNLNLPETEIGDYCLIMDTGANSYALWSMHCSQLMPRIIGIKGNEFSVLKEAQTFSDLENFWQ